MIALNEQIGAAIKEKYGTIAAFAQETGIPYSTLSSMVKNGVNNSKFSMVMGVCGCLGIDVFNNADMNLSANDTKLAGMFSLLDENGAELVSAVLDCEYKRINKFKCEY